MLYLVYEQLHQYDVPFVSAFSPGHWPRPSDAILGDDYQRIGLGLKLQTGCVTGIRTVAYYHPIFRTLLRLVERSLPYENQCINRPVIANDSPSFSRRLSPRSPQTSTEGYTMNPNAGSTTVHFAHMT